MKVQFINNPEEELFDTVIAIDNIILDGVEIGHAYLRDGDFGKRYQVALEIVTTEKALHRRELIHGHGNSREAALKDAIINTRKKMEIAVQKLAAMEAKITGVEIHEQKEEPNTTGRILG